MSAGYTLSEEFINDWLNDSGYSYCDCAMEDGKFILYPIQVEYEKWLMENK